MRLKEKIMNVVELLNINKKPPQLRRFFMSNYY